MMNMKLNKFIGEIKPSKELEIIRVDGNWVTGRIGGDPIFNQSKGCYFQAKVFAHPSKYGLYNGRISKLVICDSPVWAPNLIIYSYDRGGDHGTATKKGIKMRGKLLKVFPKILR